MSLVERYTDSGASVITLQDRDNSNRLTPGLVDALLAAANASLADAEARALVLRSAADAFCLGMDLERARAGGAGGAGALEHAVHAYGELLHLLHTSPKPVVCLVDGDVRAGGVGLVCACDVVLSSSRTTFEMGEVLFGLIPANVLPYLLARRLAPQKARYLVLTAGRISADEARRLGLVDEVFEPEGLERGARAVLKTVMRAAPSALAEAKAFSRALERMHPDEARSAAEAKLLEMLRRPEVRKGIEAFVSGDLPAWFGRFRPSRSLTGAETGAEPGAETGAETGAGDARREGGGRTDGG